MQTLDDYTAKNSVSLHATGPCQFCAATVQHGVEECIQLFDEVCGREFQDLRYAKVHLLTVDAHALQHSEVHGEKSDAYHLLRLGYILESGSSASVTDRYDFLNSFFSGKVDVEKPTPPPAQERGDRTIKHIHNAKTPQDHCNRVYSWADDVWKAWSHQHEWYFKTIELVKTA